MRLAVALNLWWILGNVGKLQVDSAFSKTSETVGFSPLLYVLVDSSKSALGLCVFSSHDGFT